MILVVREEVFRREIVEMAAAGRQLRQDDFAGNRVTLVEIDCGSDVRIHAEVLNVDALIRPWTS
jgi:hypothetical protein